MPIVAGLSAPVSANSMSTHASKLILITASQDAEEVMLGVWGPALEQSNFLCERRRSGLGPLVPGPDNT